MLYIEIINVAVKSFAPGAPAGGGRSTRNRKQCCRKMVFFLELYKLTKVLEDGIENWEI